MDGHYHALREAGILAALIGDVARVTLEIELTSATQPTGSGDPDASIMIFVRGNKGVRELSAVMSVLDGRAEYGEGQSLRSSWRGIPTRVFIAGDVAKEWAVSRLVPAPAEAVIA